MNVTPIKAAKTGYIIVSAVLTVLGCIMAAMAAGLPVSVICSIIGLVFMGFGAVRLVGYFSRDPFKLAFQFDLAEGILYIMLGIDAFIEPENFWANVGTTLGVCILLDGLLKVQTSVDSKVFGVETWWGIAIAAVLPVMTGAALIFYNDANDAVRYALLGAAFVFDGIMNLITVLIAVKYVKRARPDLAELIEDDSFDGHKGE